MDIANSCLCDHNGGMDFDMDFNMQLMLSISLGIFMGIMMHVETTKGQTSSMPSACLEQLFSPGLCLYQH